MAYRLACGDVMPGCSATFEADDEPELMRRVAEHAAADHGVAEVTPEVRAAVEARVRRT